MTGGEIVAVGDKMVEAVGKKVLAENDEIKDALVRGAEDTLDRSPGVGGRGGTDQK